MTKPFRMSSVRAPFNLIKTFSPGRAAETGSSFAHTSSTLYVLFVGMTMTFIPGRIIPDSTLPIAIVPRSVYRSNTGMRSGRVGSRPSISKVSSKLNRVGDDVLFSLDVYMGFHQSQSASDTSSFTLGPPKPDIGINFTSFLITKPHDFKKGLVLFTHSSKRSLLHCTVGSSILFTATMRYETPNVLHNMACSRVCPPRSKPVSNSPFRAEMTNIPTSACDAPCIMFGT